MPKIAERHPDIMYLVVGNTHPGVKKQYGEEYRDHLNKLASELNVDKHLYFIDRFVEEQELINYLSGADIYITPYLNEAQVSSGSLSYAIGAGAAIISTPYWHAKELLDENRGVLFDFRDAEGLSSTINELLDKHELAALKKNAYEYGKRLRWPSIGSQYISVLKKVLSKPTNGKKIIAPLIDHRRIPEFSLEHVIRLTDNTGIIQHAKYGIPNFKEGYSLDDNARALLMILMACQQKKFSGTNDLLSVYLSYIHFMQKEDGTFRNFLNHDRQFLDEVSSEDCFGRVIWALGYLICNPPANSYAELGGELFHSSIQNYKNLKNLRGYANTLIGVAYYLRAHPGHEEMFRILTSLTNSLMNAYKQSQDYKWRWFEDSFYYDNAILPLALLHSSEITGDAEVKKIALDAMRFLEQVTFRDGCFIPVGNNGWYSRHDDKMPLYDQQAIETMGMVLLYYQAYESTQNAEYIRKMFSCYLWFVGENTLRVPLYDHETKGCCDGLQPDGINRNQGAESTLAYIISHLTVLKAFEIEYEYNVPVENEELYPE